MIRRPAATYVIILALVLGGVSGGRVAAEPGEAAVFEVRVLLDSGSCPVAAELWLLDTPDSVMGIETVMAWDQPNLVHFILADSSESTGDSTGTSPESDSIMALLGGAGVTAAADFSVGLIADWGYARAQARTRSSIRIAAVAEFIEKSGTPPLPPGASGLLCRIPLEVIPLPVGAPPADSMTLYLDANHTRISNPNGKLIKRFVKPPATILWKPCPPPR